MKTPLLGNCVRLIRFVRKKEFFLSAFVFAIFLSVSCSSAKDSIQFKAMDTYMTVTSYGAKSSKANRLVKKRILELESYISVTDSQSDVYKINAGGKTFVFLHPETEKLFSFSLDMAEKTEGAFNPALYPVTKLWGFTEEKNRVPLQSEIDKALLLTDFSKAVLNAKGEKTNEAEPDFSFKEEGMMFDFGAVGKGLSCDEAVKIFKANGIKSAILNLGGNVHVVGLKTDGSEWNIGVKNPWVGEPAVGIKIKDSSVTTSGGYERFFFDENGKKYIHIFDSKTGFPVENEIESVSIIAESSLYADALSTALFAMGLEKAIDFWKKHRDFQMIIFTKDEEIFYTKGLEEKITFFFDFSKTVSVD